MQITKSKNYDKFGAETDVNRRQRRNDRIPSAAPAIDQRGRVQDGACINAQSMNSFKRKKKKSNKIPTFAQTDELETVSTTIANTTRITFEEYHFGQSNIKALTIAGDMQRARATLHGRQMTIRPHCD